MRQHRRFLLDQLVGFGMICIATTMFWRPMSAVLTDGQLYVMAALFLIFGWILAYKQTTGHFAFFVLTLPILINSLLYMVFVALHPSSSAIPAAMMMLFDAVLQYSHARQEEWRRWMNL